MASKPYTLRIADGGRLNTTLSLENVPETGFTRILNLRRFGDQLIRTEGWIKFVDADSYAFDGTETVLRLAELNRPNGDRCIVGASRTKLKKYDTGTGAWVDIAGGLTPSSSGRRWQVVPMNGYLVLNNTVDLPVSFRVEDAAVTPLYELRETGVARVGRICEYNGFLMLGDITEIKADQLAPWMNGYGSYTVASSTAKVANFNILLGDHQKRFDVTTAASTIVASLPTLAFSDKFYCWLKKVDGGAGTVVTSPTVLDETVVLDSVNDLALVWWTGKAWGARVFPSGSIPATDPYGTPPDAIVNRLPWTVANGEYGEPTGWAPALEAVMSAAGTSVTLPFKPHTWVAKTTRVGVISGGPSGDILGGQTGFEDGVLVTAIGSFNAATMGVAITLETSTDTGISYPRVVTVTRWTDISTIVARYNLQGDGGAIVAMATLGQQLVIYGAAVIYLGRYLGDATNPFLYQPRFPSSDQSLNLPLFGDAVATINGQFHLYPGVGGRFYAFDGVSWPTIHRPTDDARELFFDGAKESDEVYTVSNPYTKQQYFCRPDLTFAYDIEFSGVSEIDAQFDAAAMVRDPGSSDRWFILAIGKNVFTYGLVANAATNLQTWLRDGVAPTAILKSGLISANLMGDEKLLSSYTPVIASDSPDAAIEVQLYETYNPSAAPVALLSPPESLPTPSGEAYFTTAFQAIFFQDEITLVTEADEDFRLSARIWEFDRIGSAAGVTRRVTT